MSERRLYEQRFPREERAAKARVWEVLCAEFFQRYVRDTDTVLDVGAGFCEFINNIGCAVKYAVDADEHVRENAAPDVQVHLGKASELTWLADSSVDVVFASNFFEHIETKDELLVTLRELHRTLRGGGKIIILQPNIRYAYRVYWDFFDHHLPLSHESMVEALEMTGFDPVEVRPRFLPYTTRSALPQWPILVKLYLRIPLVHRLLGQQMLIVARSAGQ